LPPIFAVMLICRNVAVSEMLSFIGLTVAISGVVFFDSETPVFVTVLVAILAGLGLRTIPTIKTLVVQWAVPRRLLGASMLISFLLILMVPEVSVDAEVEDKRAPQPAVAGNAAE
jgi:hypothetical protein